MSKSSIWPWDRIISGAITPGQSGPESDGNEVVRHIPQSSSITRASPTDCLILYPEHSFFLHLCRVAFSVFYSPNRLSLVHYYMISSIAIKYK